MTGGRRWKGGRGGQGRRPLDGIAATLAIALGAVTISIAQQPNPNAPANFIKVQAPVIALTHARVIDGTGAAARENQTVVIRDGNIASASAAAAPAGATVVDLPHRSRRTCRSRAPR